MPAPIISKAVMQLIRAQVVKQTKAARIRRLKKQAKKDHLEQLDDDSNMYSRDRMRKLTVKDYEQGEKSFNPKTKPGKAAKTDARLQQKARRKFRFSRGIDPREGQR